MNSSTAGTRTHWSARQLATMGLLLALGVVISFIEFPLLPGTDFLKYDASNVTALLAGFAYGPVAGSLLAILIPWIHTLFAGNPWGAIMSTGIGLAYVLPATLIYRASRGLRQPDNGMQPGSTLGSALNNSRKMSGNSALIIGLIISSIIAIAVAIGMNLVITPIYTGMPVSAIVAMILPILLPFNALKVLLNSVLGFILMKSLHSLMR
ncbi:MAG: ECF transporter S component [Actinomycetia bacterium]|nr:ECF transporter S component [Actinomycetes bacterium]